MREVAVNEAGLRIGEDHHNAKLTNSEIERIRSLHEDEGLGYGTIAKLFEVNKSAIAKIRRYEMRGQTIADVRRRPTEDDLPRIENLRAQGMTWPEISEALGFPKLLNQYEQLVGKKQRGRERDECAEP